MRISIALTALVGAIAFASPASAQSFAPQEADRAFEAREQGQSLSLPEVERRVVPRMRGYSYLGPEKRGANYRLKFKKEGRIVWVDVDARSGRIIGRHGF